MSLSKQLWSLKSSSTSKQPLTTNKFSMTKNSPITDAYLD